MLTLHIWTDGACSGKPPQNRGLGGWAAIIVGPDMKLAVYGCEDSTTNNRMELMAAIEGLEALGEESVIVTIHTDSSYVKNAFTQGWIKKWQTNRWISSKGDPVANRGLWERLLEAVDRHQVRWEHIRGHQKTVNERNFWNHQADALAVKAKQQQIAGIALL